MAMPPTALRYRRSKAYFILFVSGFLLLMMPISVLSSGVTKADTGRYLACFASMIILAFVSWLMYRRASNREPVLIFTSEGLQVPLKNNLFIQWGEITEWKIRRYKSSHSLIIYTPSDKTRIDITWLDLPVKEIERLMSSYIRQPGPGGFRR